MPRFPPPLWPLLVLLLSLSAALPARAETVFEQTFAGLADTSRSKIRKAVTALGELGDDRALPALIALRERQLRVTPERQLLIEAEDGSLTDAISGAPVSSNAELRTPRINNSVRRRLGPAIARLQLNSANPDTRYAAARELADRPPASLAPLLRERIEVETHAATADKLRLALAQLDLRGDDNVLRRAALETIGVVGGIGQRPLLEPLLARDADGAWQEPDVLVRGAATRALERINSRQNLIDQANNLFFGLSLGSVLLLAALGLAITFGLMGVINMAHGEMLMLGAYTTYVVQNLFQAHLPELFDAYLLAAIPLAFLVAAAIGVLMERLVIRHLYHRPLESLLATWGLSLVLIQTVRLIFGAQNVAVANPAWLSGGIELAEGLVLTWNRLFVIVFAVLVLLAVWTLFRRSRLGLHLRAVTQNRPMAEAMGIRSQRIDMWTFALGSGVAGLGGVALSQLGNVGPELGQAYIVDSFMVVVLGGVGELLGAVAGSLTLGLVSKFLEPSVGAVFGKVLVLIFIILFIQRRPQGMFALKGRAAEG